VVDENVSMPESDGLVIGEVCYYGFEILFPFPEDNRGRLWVPFSSGENIVYGKNGAGKSTVISAIKSALSGLKDAALEAEIYLYIKILDNGDDSSADLEEPEAFLENEQEFINEDEESDDLSETSEHLENAFDSEVEDASRVLFGELVELEGSVVKSFVEGIARADILKGHLEGYDLDAFFEVAKKRGFHPPNISPGHFLTSDWTNLSEVTLEDAVRLLLTAQLVDDELMRDDEPELSVLDLVGPALNQVAESRIFRLEPIGETAPVWRVSPAARLSFNASPLDQLIGFQVEMMRKELENFYEQCDGKPTVEQLDIFLESNCESEFLNNCFATNTFLDHGNSGNLQFCIEPTHNFVTAAGWTCHFVPELTMPHKLIDLNKEVNVNDWLISNFGVDYENEYEIRWSKERHRSPELVVKSSSIDYLRMIVEHVGSIVSQLDSGISSLRVHINGLDSWLNGKAFELEANLMNSEHWVNFSALSGAQQNSVKFGIALSSFPEVTIFASGVGVRENLALAFVVGDEIDHGLHISAVENVYRVIAQNSCSSFITSHSPVALRTNWGAKMHLFKEDSGRVALERLEVGNASNDLAERLGVDVSDLLALIRCVVFVEGEHDRVCIDLLLNHIWSDLSVKNQTLVVPTRGHSFMGSAADSEIVVRYTSSELLLVVDNVQKSRLEKLIRDASELIRNGNSPKKVRTICGFDALRKSASKEELTLIDVIERAIDNGRVSRLHVFGFSVHDIIMLFSPEKFGLSLSWDELGKEFKSHGVKGQNFKTFLREKHGAKISVSHLTKVIESLDQGWPEELLSLGNKISEIVSKISFDLMFGTADTKTLKRG
jgi:hypothetical protein